MTKVKLIAVTTLVAAALVLISATTAAGAAGSTVLCKTASSPCPVGSQYPAGTTFTAALKSGTTLNLITSLDNYTCTTSSATLKTTEKSGAPLAEQITALAISGCTDQYGNSCTVSANDLPYSAGVLVGAASGDGSLTIDTLDLQFHCGTVINCTFDAPEAGVTGTVTGGHPASVQFSNDPLGNTGGGFCPSSAAVSAAYTTTGTNSAVWVEASP